MAFISDPDQFLLDAYSGQGGFADGSYLVPHPREENTGKYLRRQQLASYPNYCRKVVDVYRSHLFRRPPQREGDAQVWQRLQADADGAGSDLDETMRRNWRLALLLGTVYLLVDRPQGQAATRADESRLQPYVATRLPKQVAASSMDSRGRLVSITFRETAEDGKSTVYRTVDRTGWRLTNEQGGAGQLQGGVHNIGQVPVVPLHSTELNLPTELRATPWAQGIAYACFDLYNTRSELRELLRSQTFSILALPVADKQEADKLRDLTISVENALTYNPAGGGSPSFIAPPPDPVTSYQKEIDAIITRIYQLANLEFVGGVQQSGVALAFHFQAAGDTLSDMAASCEKAERQVATLACAWVGQTWDGRVTYPADFAIADLAAELKTGMDALSAQISPTFDRSLKKRLAREILGATTSPQTLQEIDDEIDAEGDPYGDRAAREAGGTPPGGTPSA